MRLRWVVPFVTITTAAMSHGRGELAGKPDDGTSIKWVYYCGECHQVIKTSTNRLSEAIRCEVPGHPPSQGLPPYRCRTCQVRFVSYDRPGSAGFPKHQVDGSHVPAPLAQTGPRPDDNVFVPVVEPD